MKIEIWTDFACPFCYIGKKRFEQALDNFHGKDKVEVIYKSFILVPDAPKETNLSAIEELAKSKGIPKEQAKMSYEHVVRMAKTENLEYNLDTIKAVSTNDAHRLMQWAKGFGKERELSTALFDGYFVTGKNLADYNTLAEIALSVGLDPKKAREVLEFDQYLDLVEKDISDASMLGVHSVPTFVVNREYGVSGAQREEYFTKMLEEAYQEMYPSKIKITKDDSACGPDGCDI